MSQMRRMVVLVGSLRTESYCRKIAKNVIGLAPASLRGEILEIGHLSHYNQDLETDTPPADWVTFRDRIRAADAVLFVTPEYNRSVPGVLKNAIDIASRPRVKNAFDRKPGAVVSASIGTMGGFGANHHLRQSLAYLNVPTLGQPEVYIGTVDKRLDPDGRLIDASTRELLHNFIHAFATWIDLVTPTR